VRRSARKSASAEPEVILTFLQIPEVFADRSHERIGHLVAISKLDIILRHWYYSKRAVTTRCQEARWMRLGEGDTWLWSIRGYLSKTHRLE
jgi:hypothetical protein